MARRVSRDVPVAAGAAEGAPAARFDVSPVRSREELSQILELQRKNLVSEVPPEVAAAQGFVTVAHTLEALEAMHELAPSIIARAPDTLAGYALAMPVESKAHVPILAPMFEKLATLSFRGKPLASLRYYVMGQVCVAGPYRGQGVFDALYQGHCAHYADRYDLLVTEIATRNGRSLRAHERVGFEPLSKYQDQVDEWLIVAWDLR